SPPTPTHIYHSPATAPLPNPPPFPTRRSSDLPVETVDSTASNAQLAANVRRTVPVITCSCAPAIGPRTSAIAATSPEARHAGTRSEEHTSELQSRGHLVCRLLLEKKKNSNTTS